MAPFTVSYKQADLELGIGRRIISGLLTADIDRTEGSKSRGNIIRAEIANRFRHAGLPRLPGVLAIAWVHCPVIAGCRSPAPSSCIECNERSYSEQDRKSSWLLIALTAALLTMEREVETN